SPNKKASGNFAICSDQIASMRAISFSAPSLSSTFRHARQFIGNSFLKSKKPECISAEIARAFALSATWLGHAFPCRYCSFTYSKIAKESQTVTSPSTNVGTLAVGVTLASLS
ncbi:hypothetical protein D047_0924B, partial [Vibrio parahaemolyticus VPTS-2010_2]